MPDGWTLTKTEATAVTMTPNTKGGVIFITAGTTQAATTTEQEFGKIQSDLKNKYPDVKVCVPPQSVAVGGVTGTIAGFAYPLQTQSGSVIPSCEVWWISVASDGKYIYLFDLWMQASIADKLSADGSKVLASIRWKSPA